MEASTEHADASTEKRGIKRRASVAKLDEELAVKVPPTTKSALMILYELYKDVKFEVTQDPSSPLLSNKCPPFLAILHVNGQIFEGRGRSKQVAKQMAAAFALNTLKNLHFTSDGFFMPTVGSDDRNEYPDDSKIDPLLFQPLHVRSREFANRVCQLICEKLLSLKEEVGENYIKYKVLSGIVMTRSNKTKIFSNNVTTLESSSEEEQKPDEDLHLICITTGTKCMSGNNISPDGNALIDYHAEVLARRGLMSFLLKEMEMLETLGPNSSTVLQFCNEPDVNVECEGTPNNNVVSKPCRARYSLRDGVEFHLYISSAPCGDSRIFSSSLDFENSTEQILTDEHPLRKNRGLLRTKIENGEGTIPMNGRSSSHQTWDGIVGGERLLTMSCSDKCLLWNSVGIQGALLSGLLQKPIYYSSISLSDLFEESHLERAAYGRVRHINSMPEVPIRTGYALHAPQLLVTSPDTLTTLPIEDFTSNKSPNHSLIWVATPTYATDGQHKQLTEVISCLTGVNCGSEIPSCLSKRSLLVKFKRVVEFQREQIQKHFNNFNQWWSLPYSMIKLLFSHPGYFEMKRVLYRECYWRQLGAWSRKPFEMELFSLCSDDSQNDKSGENL